MCAKFNLGNSKINANDESCLTQLAAISTPTRWALACVGSCTCTSIITCGLADSWGGGGGGGGEEMKDNILQAYYKQGRRNAHTSEGAGRF